MLHAKSCTSKSQSGFSLVEALIAIAMASIIVVVLGSSLAMVRRVYTASDMKDRATALAREYLDLVNEIKNDTSAFACRCGGACAAPCTASDGQTCTAFPNYASCWVQYPVGPLPNTDLRLFNNGAKWIFQSGKEVGAEFTRWIDIENLCRDAAFNFTNCAGAVIDDKQAKKITVTVSWSERGVAKITQLSEIFTAWENLP